MIHSPRNDVNLNELHFERKVRMKCTFCGDARGCATVRFRFVVAAAAVIQPSIRLCERNLDERRNPKYQAMHRHRHSQSHIFCQRKSTNVNTIKTARQRDNGDERKRAQTRHVLVMVCARRQSGNFGKSNDSSHSSGP